MQTQLTHALKITGDKVLEIITPALITFGPFAIVQGLIGLMHTPDHLFLMDLALANGGAIMVMAGLAYIFRRQTRILSRLDALENK